MPPFFIITKDESGPNVVAFHGRISYGRETERCRQKIKELLEGGDRRFLFDLDEVQYVDSAGVGFLVSCLTTFQQAGAKLRLTRLPDKVRHVLKITRLHTVFQIFDSREQALKNFS